MGQVNRYVREEDDPDHLLDNAKGDAEGKDPSEHLDNIRPNDERLQKTPHQPAKNAENEVFHSPGFQRNRGADVVTPAAVIRPFLEPKEDSKHYARGDKDGGMHEDGVGAMLLASNHVR
jgi:hypothetical protein